MFETLMPTIALEDRIRGCWLGKSIGGTLGLPAEGKMERLNFTFYDPVPTIAPPNDDLELQLVWLHLIEQSDGKLEQGHFAKAWIENLHYMWDEYGRCRWNLRRGVPLEAVGTFENPFLSSMGSPIRSEIWACLFPGDSDSAAHYAALDASLDHGMEGIAGEVVFAVMQSAIAAGSDFKEAIALALRYIPEDGETAKAIDLVLGNYKARFDAWACWRHLLEKHGHENFTHAPLNVALTLWALCYGKGDFAQSILLAANAGYDTDCTAATVGATLGLVYGERGIPPRWSAPIGENVYTGPGIVGIQAPATLSELTERTVALLGKLEPRKWNPSQLHSPSPSIPLETLPGTISLMPLGGDQSVPWANGELPAEVKAAGGATWRWEKSSAEARNIICLARGGARLFLNEHLVIDCPPNLPYVPATHRNPAGSSVEVRVEPGSHSFRLELNISAEDQEASVILTYPNQHIAPWTFKELPYASELKDPMP